MIRDQSSDLSDLLVVQFPEGFFDLVLVSFDVDNEGHCVVVFQFEGSLFRVKWVKDDAVFVKAGLGWCQGAQFPRVFGSSSQALHLRLEEAGTSPDFVGLLGDLFFHPARGFGGALNFSCFRSHFICSQFSQIKKQIQFEGDKISRKRVSK